MADTNTLTDAQIFGFFPDTVMKERGSTPAQYALQKNQNLRDMFATVRSQIIENRSRVLGNTGLQTSDGASQIITEYEINYSAGSVMIDGVNTYFPAATNLVILGTETLPSYTIAGADPVALTADGQTFIFSLIACIVSGATVLRGIFGAEAADGAEVAPTDAQIKAGLEASADGANLTKSAFVKVGEMTIQRTAVDTMVFTHVNGVTNSALAGRRSVGTLWDAVA